MTLPINGPPRPSTVKLAGDAAAFTRLHGRADLRASLDLPEADLGRGAARRGGNGVAFPLGPTRSEGGRRPSKTPQRGRRARMARMRSRATRVRFAPIADLRMESCRQRERARVGIEGVGIGHNAAHVRALGPARRPPRPRESAVPGRPAGKSQCEEPASSITLGDFNDRVIPAARERAAGGGGGENEAQRHCNHGASGVQGVKIVQESG